MRKHDPTRLLSIAPLLAVFAFSAPEQSPHCETDALGKLYCAKTPEGTAVVDDLGRVLCAPGDCVEFEGDWMCSTTAGGAAGIAPDGPVCGGDCRPPTASECEEL